MSKFFLKFLVIILIVFGLTIVFLSYFGIETDKFDKLIKTKANEINQHVKLSFQKTKIHINLSELNLVVRLQNPKILIKNNEIDLSKLNLSLPIRSFFTSDFLLKRANVAFEENNIKDLTKITRLFLPVIINKKLDKIFHQGTLEGEFIIPFKSDGSIGKDYGFVGKISQASINLTKELSITQLTTEISHKKDKENDVFDIIISRGSVYNLELADSKINFKRNKNEIKVKSLLRTKGKLNFAQVKKISKLAPLNLNFLKDFNGIADLNTNISFNLSKRLKVENFTYSTEGNIEYLEIQTEENKTIKEYLPEFDPKIILKDTKVNIINSNSNNVMELNGLIKAKSYFDAFKIKRIYDYNEKNSTISGDVNLTNSKVRLSKLNYTKNSGKKSELKFEVNFVLNKYYNIKNLTFFDEKSKIYLSSIKLNQNFELKDFKELQIKTFQDKIKNNDFLVKKSKKIIISGEVYDAEPLLKSLYKKSDKKTFSNSFNSEISIKFNNVLTGTGDNVSNFATIASIVKGSYNKLSLKGNFSKNEIVEMSIYQIDKDTKTLQVISDRARPFVKNFDFIEGFEGGKLEYESVISKEDSNSSLTITEFKVSKVPALAQLLTLASLQGIADTLSGEGIRFESFEMKSKTEGNVINIDDALAIGPAVSILLSGYVDKGKIVSLRGTLVPATKLNAIIASIPVVGDILVGKKSGEGVVGVSFKMKGPPKDIKTTVNPIKTLTPRFIVRAVEKMKRQKKEETK